MKLGALATRARLLLLCSLLLLTLPFLTAGTVFRDPGLLPGSAPGDVVITASDLARLRSQPLPPAITARAAIVWDVTNNAELYAKAPDTPVAPASTTKMLTSLLVLERGNLAEPVTIEPGDLGKPDESAMGLAPGDRVTLEDLLYGMLLPSGGDAARAAARVIGTALLAGQPGDPVARFVDEMNARAAQLGATHTHFTTPDGYDAPGQYSTARDLLLIANQAMRNPLFAQIVATKQATRTTIDGRKTFALTNTNDLLGQRPGVHGIKTGTTDAAGECLVAAQWTANGRIISVVLGSANRYTDTIALLDYANNAFRWVPLGQGAEPAGLAPALQRWGVEFHERRVVVLPAWEVDALRYVLLLEPAGTNTPGSVRGKVSFLVGSREVLNLPVYAK